MSTKTVEVTLTLTAQGMGDGSQTEADFDSWTAFVDKHADERTGFVVAVRQFDFANGPDCNRVEGREVGSEERTHVHRVVAALWEEFCEDPTLWPSAAPNDEGPTLGEVHARRGGAT